MKTPLIFLLILMAMQGSAQKNIVCYVTSISGNAQKANGQQLSVGDTIYQSQLSMIKLFPKSSITLYNADEGSVQLPAQESSFSFITAMLDVFKAKSSRVNLSSRGDCDAATLDDCINTDSAINRKLLLIDSLMLPEPVADDNTEIKNTFFLQWKCNGKIVNKILNCSNGHICIKPADLMYDTIKYDESYGAVTLGVIKISAQNKTPEKLSSFEIYCTTSSFINQYYASLQQLMKDRSSKEIFSRFYTELYIFYGRPDMCYLKNLVHYTD
jgi:hypothetical protein